MMDTSQTWNLKTPSSSRKKFQKLSLRKAALSCPPKGAPAASATDTHDGKVERNKGARSVSPIDLDRFTTPPFVTKRRPTYTSSTLIDLSEAGITPDLVVNKFSSNLDSFKTGNTIAFSTPINNDKTENFDLFDVVKDDIKNNKDFNSKSYNQKLKENIESDNDYEHSLDVRLNNLNEPSEECISPKTANILNDMYGDVWKHTPGLFKKSKSVIRNRQKEKNTTSYDEVLNKLDSLSLYVNSLTDVKAKHVQTNIKTFFNTSTKDMDSSRKKNQNGDLLKPKMLSFELTIGLDKKNNQHPNEKDFGKSKALSDLIPCPNLDDSDLILSTQKVGEKNTFLSSSDSDENIDLKPTKLFNVEECQESDKENSKGNKVKKKLSKKWRDTKHNIEFKTRGDQDCSVIIIESDNHIERGFDKTSEKKIRKLFRNISKTNCMFDDVEFVTEDIRDELKTRQDLIEIVDDKVGARQILNKNNLKDFYSKKDKKISTDSTLKINNVLKSIDVVEIIDDRVSQSEATKTYRKFNDAVNDDNTLIDQFISEGVKNISLKTKEPNNKTKLINKAPVKKRAPLKKGILPIVERENVNTDEIQVYSFMASLSDNVPPWRCDKEAGSYKSNYTKKKNDLIKKLFSMFNEKVFNSQLDADLPIVWNANLNSTAGRAHNKIVRSKTSGIHNDRRSRVELSNKVVDSAQRLRDTLAHELCHVATWLIDGQLRDGHGPCWKKWVAKTLQAYPELVSIPVCHTLSIHYKYTYKCIKCGYSIDRHSKSIDTDKKRCGYCYGTLECIRNRKTKDGLVISTPVKGAQRAASGFALYVKENYGNVRGPHTPHKQAMQYLGRQYASLKAATPDAKQ